jgi:branched-chain amino acid transport system ATP-binding protein
VNPILQVRDLHCYYGTSHVLFGLSLEVSEGEVVVLLGRNGAGKSTTLKCIMGMHRQKSGSIRFRGHDIDGLPSDRISRLGLGYVPEERRIFRGLTVAENLDAARQPARSGQSSWDEKGVLKLFPRLEGMLRRRADSLSGGEQQMLAIARTLMTNPILLLLDEPSEGLAPIVVEQMRERLTALKETGTTVLLSEQNLVFSLRLSDRAYVIEKGEIKFEGTPRELITNESVRRAYLMV